MFRSDGIFFRFHSHIIEHLSSDHLRFGPYRRAHINRFWSACRYNYSKYTHEYSISDPKKSDFLSSAFRNREDRKILDFQVGLMDLTKRIRCLSALRERGALVEMPDMRQPTNDFFLLLCCCCCRWTRQTAINKWPFSILVFAVPERLWIAYTMHEAWWVAMLLWWFFFLFVTSLSVDGINSRIHAKHMLVVFPLILASFWQLMWNKTVAFVFIPHNLHFVFVVFLNSFWRLANKIRAARASKYIEFRFVGLNPTSEEIWQLFSTLIIIITSCGDVASAINKYSWRDIQWEGGRGARQHQRCPRREHVEGRHDRIDTCVAIWAHKHGESVERNQSDRPWFNAKIRSDSERATTSSFAIEQNAPERNYVGACVFVLAAAMAVYI